MQAPPDVVERGAELRQRIGLLVDVFELDGARTHQRQQLVSLPVHAGVTDSAAGVVPDGEIWNRHEELLSVPKRRTSTNNFKCGRRTP